MTKSSHLGDPSSSTRPWVWVAIFLFVLGISQGCHVPIGRQGIKGSGVLNTEKREAALYSRIDVGGSVVLDWQPGKEPSLEVTAEDNLLPLLITEIDGATLKIYFKEAVNPTKDVIVKAAGPALDGLIGGGASRSQLKGIQSDDFKLSLSGASQCSMAGKAKMLSVDCTGASALKAEPCEAAAAVVAASGASTAVLRAKDLKSGRAEGASKITVNQISTDRLKIELEGGSVCTLSGQAGNVVIRADGASTLHAAELKSQSVEVHVAGASRVEVAAAQRLTGEATGSAHVSYHGNPMTQNVQTAGAASVRKN